MRLLVHGHTSWLKPFSKCIWLLAAMLSKNSLPSHWDRLAPTEAFQTDVEDLFAANQVSAGRCQRLLEKAVKAGVPGMQGCKRPVSFKNAARNLKRRKMATTFWPDVYTFEGPVWDKKGAKTVMEDLAIWLPLELLCMMWDLGVSEVCLSTERMDVQTKAHLEKLRTKFGLPDLMGVGLHGDGVPNNYDRTESAHVVSINLPGVGGAFSRMRIPICVLPSQKMVQETMDAILEVVAWSLRHLQAGTHPECRHDGSPWNATDKSRSQKHGPLGFNASLVEVRGDWDWYSKVFHFPYHSELDGICWLCPCKRKEDCVFFNCRFVCARVCVCVFFGVGSCLLVAAF